MEKGKTNTDKNQNHALTEGKSAPSVAGCLVRGEIPVLPDALLAGLRSLTEQCHHCCSSFFFFVYDF